MPLYEDDSGALEDMDRRFPICRTILLIQRGTIILAPACQQQADDNRGENTPCRDRADG